ncbi:unnamed protein product [Paramecium primaurelia]|uniref:Uncharacterized protein n=1 Tax=Paramecium primaurelia TaxID=5886 RepID=A0A8S1MSJ1_PARPR|nr:unnamed protein product [Paramecium primaurelia]
MSLEKRQLSSSKLKFDADYFLNIIEQQEKKRPGSCQPYSSLTYQSTPRKPFYYGKLISSEIVNHQHHTKKSNNSEQKKQLIPSVTQSSSLGVVIPLKTYKSQLQFDKQIILTKQNSSSQNLIKSSLIPNLISKGEKTQIQKLIEKQSILTSSGKYDKQFTQNNQIERIVILNKSRQIPYEKQKQVPLKQYYQNSFDQKRPIIQQMQSNIIISQKKHIIQPQQIEKKQETFNTKQLISQFQENQSQGFNDFPMNSERRNLQQIFSSIQLQLKEAALQAKQNQFYLREIQEQPDDANPSLNQIILYQFQK